MLSAVELMASHRRGTVPCFSPPAFKQSPYIYKRAIKDIRPSTSCTGVCLAITMLQYYICVGIVLTVVLVLGLGLGFGIILYFVIGT